MTLKQERSCTCGKIEPTNTNYKNLPLAVHTEYMASLMYFLSQSGQASALLLEKASHVDYDYELRHYEQFGFGLKVN